MDIEINDLLVEDLYSKERGLQVLFFGIQLDEMWTFVQNKANKQWLWLALNPINRQIIAFHVGSQSSADALLFYEKIPDIFKAETGFFSDYWQAFVDVFKENNHFGVGKNHEMGGIRMGKDPKTSMLNKWNQMHACKNVFVTDGGCMTSTATQNPSLTYMALTARAVDYAVKEMRKGNI